MTELNKVSRLIALDIGNTLNLSSEAVFSFIKTYGIQLHGLVYTGNVKVTEQFWISSVQNLKNIRFKFLLFNKEWVLRAFLNIYINFNNANEHQIPQNFTKAIILIIS